MRLMRRFAVSVARSPRRAAARGPAARGPAARGPAARGPAAALYAAGLGLAALAAGTSAALAAGTTPSRAAVANSPGGTRASAVPSTAIPRGRVTFTVYCASTRATAATLSGRTIGLTAQIKMRPGPAAGHFMVSVVMPGNIRPGTYNPSINCSDGTSATAALLIPPYGQAASEQLRAITTRSPAGTWLTAGGLALAGAGLVTGGIAVRRRRRRADRSDRPDYSPDPSHSNRSDHWDHSGHPSARF